MRKIAQSRNRDEDPYVALLIAVYLTAVKDARRGDPEAEEFLWRTAPHIAERVVL